MSVDHQANYHDLLALVKEWRREDRLTFVRDVMKTLVPAQEDVQRRRAPLSEALGIAATDRPPPSDDEVDQWLVDRRTEKYG